VHIVDFPSSSASKPQTHVSADKQHPKTVTQPRLENLCLAYLWKNKVMDLGWDSRPASQLSLHWATSKLSLYNFCCKQNIPFPSEDSAAIASYLCHLAEKSARPQSVRKSTRAALQHLYNALDLPSPLETEEIVLLQSALIKSGTTMPMSRSKGMPIAPFRNLFLSWEPNDRLPVKELRLKAITLLALTVMLRPSDIARKSKNYNSQTGQLERHLFTAHQITFREDGSAGIAFHGIKNDTLRSSFDFHLPGDANVLLDPVSAIRTYITRTDSQRPYPEAPGFIALQPRFRALKARSVANIMEDAIRLAGLGNHGYSAKDFRPTGATAAIESGTNPDIVMKTGQ